MNYVILIAKIFQFKEHSKLFMTFSLFMFACCVYVLSVWATGFKVHACAYFAVNVNVNVCVCVFVCVCMCVYVLLTLIVADQLLQGAESDARGDVEAAVVQGADLVMLDRVHRVAIAVPH